MVKNRYIVSVAVLIAAALLSVFILSLSPTLARISNTASWKVVYEQEPSELNSDLLKEEGQNIILGEWVAESGAQALVQSISLSSKTDINGTLSCTTDSPYITAKLSNTEITTTKTKKSITLTLTQTAEALSITKTVNVTVRVTWTPQDDSEAKAEWADFTVALCPEGKEGTSLVSGIGSNYLLSGGSKVILSDWSMDEEVTYKTKNIEILSDGSRMTGSLSCTSDSKYIVPAIDNKTDPVSVTLQNGEKHTSTLKLSLSDDAKSIESPVAVTVRVTWTGENGTAWADFEVKLIPSGTEIGNAQTAQSTIDLSTWQNTFDWNAEQKFSINCPANTDTVIVTYNGSSFPEGTKYSIDKNTYNRLGESMPISFPSNPGGVAYLYLDLSEVELEKKDNIGKVIFSVGIYKEGAPVAYGSRVTEPYYNEKTPFVAENATPESFCLDAVTVLEMTAPKDATDVKISFNGSAFPKETRYSLDNKRYNMLKADSEIAIGLSGEAKVTVFFDFSDVEFSKTPDTVTYEAKAYKGVSVLETGSAESKTDGKALEVSCEPSDMVITYDGKVTAKIKGYSEDVVFEVECLEEKDGVTSYKKASDNYGIEIEVTDADLVISNKKEEAKAGTYRLNVIRKHNGTEVERIEIPFFINY